MIYLILSIILLTIFIYKDYLKLLKITSIVTGIASILTLIIGYFIRYFFNNKITFINISKISNLILMKFFSNFLFLLGLSLIEIVCYMIINYYFKKTKLINNINVYLLF